MPIVTTHDGQQMWLSTSGEMVPLTGNNPTLRVPVQNWTDQTALAAAGGAAMGPGHQFGMLPNPMYQAPPTRQELGQDMNAMIQQAMNPYLQQLRQQQQSLQDQYRARGADPNGPFSFMNKPLSFNQPVRENDSWTFRRPSYGAFEDRGFNPGGMPAASPMGLPSTVPGLGGMFFDPYLATLAESLFGNSPWLTQGQGQQQQAPAQQPLTQAPGGFPVQGVPSSVEQAMLQPGSNIGYDQAFQQFQRDAAAIAPPVPFAGRLP